MADASDLARRFLSLWEDYLTALLSDASEVEALQCWIKAGSTLANVPGPRDRDAGAQIRQARPPADAASAARPSGERGDVVAELLRRVADLEDRVAAVERGRREAARPHRRNRRARLG